MDFEQPVGMEESGAGGSEADGAKRPGPSGLARLLIFCYCGIAGYAGVLGFARLAPARAQLAEARLRYAAAPSAWAAEGPSRERDAADAAVAKVYIILLLCPLALIGAVVSRRVQNGTYGSRVAHRAVAGIMFAAVKVLSWQVSDQMDHPARASVPLAAAPAPAPVKPLGETLAARLRDPRYSRDPAERARSMAEFFDLIGGDRFAELSRNDLRDLLQEVRVAATSFPTDDDNYPRLLAVLERLGDSASAERLRRTRPPTGAKVEARRLADADALHRAIEANDVRAFAALMKRDVDVNATGSAGCTPLHHAVAKGNSSDAAELLSKGADPNRPGQWQAGVTEYPLHRAADGNMVRLLLRHHAKVDVTDSAGMTPLHRVAGAGDEDAAFYLLKADAPVDARDGAGRTPLDVALTLPPGEKRTQTCARLKAWNARTGAEVAPGGGAAKAD